MASITSTSQNAFLLFPERLRRELLSLTRSSKMNAGIRFMDGRESEFATQDQKLLTGLALYPESRQAMESALDRYWQLSRFRMLADSSDRVMPEVIIGAGVHAAIYAATRVAMGFPKPIVIERGRPGGIFAVSARPSFYLNSENRAGVIGLPKFGDALNFLPNATIQVADFTRREFPDNSDIALAVRLALAEFATVITGETVTGIETYNAFSNNARYRVQFQSGTYVLARRVIDARGLGDPTAMGEANGSSILTLPQFMARYDQPFAMQGFRNVAVLGNGDSARVVIEALTGIGPAPMMGSLSLDRVPRISWYGRDIPQTRESYRDPFGDMRGRYLRLASYLRSTRVDSFADVTVYDTRADVFPIGPDSVLVYGQTYDHAILATGWERPGLQSIFSEFDYEEFRPGNNDRRGNQNALAKRYPLEQLYKIGPAANLGFSPSESRQGVDSVAANAVSIFRYAPRTAALASYLDSRSDANRLS